MRIYIDVSVLTLTTFVTGIQRATIEIATRMISCGKAEIVILYYNASKDTYYKIDNTAFVNYYTEHKGIKEKMITGQKVDLKEIADGSIFFDLDAVWMGRMKRSYLLPILKKQGAKIVVHVYDIISITHPQYCVERGVYNFMDYLDAHLEYADAIIVNAQATLDELRKLADTLGCKLPDSRVIFLGADFKRKNREGTSKVSQELADIVQNKPYILMVGTMEPRKNHKLVMKAYDQGLKKLGYQVIFAGYMGWNMEAFAQELKEHPDFQKGIYHLEGLDDASVSYLYENAKCLAFCSYTEGFGLPIIEALQRGTPVLAADVPVLREVGGEYCIWFEQDNVEDFVARVRDLNNVERYQAYKNKISNFVPKGWDETLIHVNRCMEEVLNGKNAK